MPDGSPAEKATDQREGGTASRRCSSRTSDHRDDSPGRQGYRWPSVRTIRTLAGGVLRVFQDTERLRQAAAGMSLEPEPWAAGMDARASSSRAASKLGGSTSRRTRGPASSTAIASPGRDRRTNRRAHSTARECGVVPPRRRSMLAEASITSTTSRRGASAAIGERGTADPAARVLGARNGRARASAAMASRPMRASISNISEMRTFRRACFPSSRNCIAPHSTTVSRRLASRWMITGRAMPASPTSIAALRATPRSGHASVAASLPRRERDDR